MHGLMMDMPLLISSLIRHADRFHGATEIVSKTVEGAGKDGTGAVHRYDYRAEWLRFTETISRGGEQVTPLHERVVQSLADIADSQSGLLLTMGEDGALVLDSRWQWPGIDVPATALSPEAAAFFEREQFILDLDDLREGRDVFGEIEHIPDWLRDDRKAWAIVPLIHYQRLVGLVVLSRRLEVRELLTLDQRHFRALAGIQEKPFRVLPADS